MDLSLKINSVPQSPICAGPGPYAIIDDRNILCTGGGVTGFYSVYDEIKMKYHMKHIHTFDSGDLSPVEQKVRSVSCADDFIGAVTEEGRVYIWGRRLNGIFNDEIYMITKPREFKIPGRAIKISCGPKTKWNEMKSMFAVILEDRSVFLRMEPRLPPNIPNVKNVIEITLDIRALDISVNGHALAIVSTDGKLYYLGNNLGMRNKEDVGIVYKNNQIMINPVHIPLPETIKQVSLAYDHIGVLSTEGNIYLWGSNFYGQLGQGWDSKPRYYEETFVDLPQKLLLTAPVSLITCQDSTTAAIEENGKLYIWGKNGRPINPSKYTGGLENVIVDNKYFTKSGYRRITKSEDIAVISHPIQIEFKLQDNGDIKNRFNYVAINENIIISTTRDGWVNRSYSKDDLDFDSDED